jgi:predicted MPP superfamily phosphohydrolase
MAIRKPDFSKVKHFPGTDGNPFDSALRAIDAVEALPIPIFAALLAVIAALAVMVRGQWPAWAALWMVYLVDWALLASLPKFGRSFGPARPPTLILAVLRLPAALLPLPWMLAVQAVGTALVIYGFWIEPHRVGLTHLRLPTPKLNAGRPLRLLHLGDLHAEIAATSRERQTLAHVQAAEPDVIVFSGDCLNLSYLDDPRALAVARSFLGELHAPLGVFAVSGSPAVDRPEVAAAVWEGLDHVRWLRDEVVTLTHEGQAIQLAGLSCTHKPFVDGPRLFQVLGEANAGQPAPFRILLYHTPDLAPEAAEAGVDLQLSGHTHGGQVRLPGYGALIAASLYGKRYESGRRQEGALTLYVIRGIGMEGKGAPRVRFLCPPEIALWEIGGAKNTNGPR